MNIRILYLINLVVALIFALALLLGPTTVLTLYGMKTGPSENLEAQLFGATLIVPALLCWFGKDTTDPVAQRGIVVSLLVSAAVSLVVTLLGALSGAMKAVGWSGVIIYLFFTIGYGYFMFFKTDRV